MNLIFLCLLCIGVTCVKGQCDTAYPEGCYDIDNIAYISCKNVDACECEPDPTAAPCTDLSVGTAAEMNADKCLELCKSVDECAFYRWEETFGLEHCSLMDVNQCQSYEPCSGEHCESGNGNGCPSEENPIGTQCNAGASFKHDGDSGKDYIHWKCLNPFDEQQTRINIYETDPIEPGTICYTERKCAAFDDPENDPDDPDFLYHTYAVHCNGDTGKWEIFPGSTNNPELFIGGGLHLTDPDCSFEPTDDLVLDKAVLTESGVSFICSTETVVTWGVDDVTVTKCSDCSCALLCNFHHTMTIEPKFQEDEGVSKWWKYSTVEGEQKEEEAKKDNVFCWEAPATDPPTLV